MCEDPDLMTAKDKCLDHRMMPILRTAEGIVAADPIPCNARITFREIELGAKPLPMAQASDQSVPRRNTFLRPKRSARRPNSSKKHP